MKIADLAAFDVDIALNEPFGIATGAQAMAANLFVRVRLDDGAIGWGEAAPFPAVNGETRAMARAAIEGARGAIVGRDARAWRAVLDGTNLPASARCAIETAVLDALLNRVGLPMWSFFGGAGTALETDMTITTGDAAHAARSATRISHLGFSTIKLKVGARDDRSRVEAVIAAAPSCKLLLDGNAAMTVDAAVALVEAARAAGGEVVLFEQPTAKDRPDELREVGRRARVPVAADESAGSLEDVLALAHAKACDVINVKITKSGLAPALAIIEAARAHGLGLMIGGMVESQLAMTVSASIACGIGGFAFVDLDTPMWMVDAPLDGGFRQEGPRLSVAHIAAGHGVIPRGL